MNKRTMACNALLLLFVILFTSPVQAANLKVVTTFSILEDFVKQLGGTKVEVASLIPFGADPHSWEPTPKEARLVAQADLLIANGGGFDQWLINLQKNAARPGVPLVIASEGLVALDNLHGHGGDPHFWLSVPNAIQYVEQISQALIKLRPEEEGYFASKFNSYVAQLEALDQNILNQLAQIPQKNRVIVTYHNAFSYFAKQYGFEVVEFLVANPESEPTARDLGRLVQLLKQQARPVIFTEPQVNIGKRYVHTLAQETQAKTYVLYSDSFDQTITSYLELMEHNCATLVEALQ